MFPLLPTIVTAAYAPIVCAAQDWDQWQASAKQESLKKLKKLIPDRAKLGVPPEYVVGTDFLPEGILSTAAKNKVDLIVMGATPVHSAHVMSHIPSAVSYQVIREARCPVLTVRG
jgi:nucleotide-binding universal stress UspA family protein